MLWYIDLRLVLIDLARERWTLRTLGRRRSSKFTLQSLSTSLSQSSSSSLLTQYCLRRAGKFATADTGFGLLWMQVLVNTADLEFYYSHLRTPGSFSPRIVRQGSQLHFSPNSRRSSSSDSRRFSSRFSCLQVFIKRRARLLDRDNPKDPISFTDNHTHTVELVISENWCKTAR